MKLTVLNIHKNILLLLFLFFGNINLAADTKVDSLTNLLKTYSSGINRINVLNQLADALYYRDPELARKYGEEALGLGKKLEALPGQLESYYQLANTYYLLSFAKEAQESAEASISLSRQLGNQRREVDASFILGRIYYGAGDLEKARENYETCQQISEKINYSEGLVNAVKGIGDIFETEGDYKHAMENYERSLEIAFEINDKLGQMAVYNSLGIIYEYQGNTDEGLKYYLQSLRAAEEIEHWKGMGAAAGNIGSLYFIQKNYDKAEEYALKSLKAYQKINNTRGIAFIYQDMGQILKDKNELDEALVYYEKALQLRTELGDKRGLSFTYFGLGHLYRRKKDVAKAYHFFEKSLTLREELGFKAGISSSVKALGQLLLESKDYRLALPYLQRALDIAQEIGAAEELNEAYAGLSDCYKGLGDYRNAYTYQQLSLTIRDSLFNLDQNKQFAEMQTLYETEKKEKQILSQKNEILELETKNEKIARQRNYFMGGGFLLGILGFLGFRLNNMRKERNDKIAFAEALIFAQETERKRIARDLHDGIGQSLLLIKKQMASTHETTLENQAMISSTLEEVRSISRDLHPFQLEKFGLTASINDMIDKVAKSTNLFITREIDDVNAVLSDRAEINFYRTIQEALSNIVKHADATAVKVIVQSIEAQIRVKILDNGKGFDHELAVVKSKSLGLRTMHERIASLGGKLKIDRGTPNGTVIAFTIPKQK